MDVGIGNPAAASPRTLAGRAGESLLTARLRAMLSWPAPRDKSGPPIDPVVRLIRAHRLVHPGADVAVLRKSYQVAEREHRGQMRKSGEPYITHPLAVAEILAHLGMDTTTLTAALLHDTVEDTTYTLAQLREDFGPGTAHLVDGVTKFDKTHIAQAEAETIRKMIVAAGRDIRVLIIKLADRMHNMQTLDARSAASRARIAGATREVLVPLCDRLGIQALKRELEDSVLFHAEPDAYKRIDDTVTRERPRWNAYVSRVVDLASASLRRERLAGRVEPRPRHYYSIWKDTESVGAPAPIDLPRIVVIIDGEEPDCYAALGAIHQSWRPIPGRFKDFIAAPKNNLYRSLHTTVLGPDDQMVEVLIRTEQMHRAVEYGVIARFRFPARPASRGALARAARSAVSRGGPLSLINPMWTATRPEPAKTADEDMTWLRRALLLEQAAPDAVQFVQSLRCDLAEQQIQVWTRGKQLLLPADSTPVDVAYELGASTGDRCVAATVNGVLTQLNAKLTEGDVVDILVSRASKHPGPRAEWLDFVKSPKARLRLSQRFTEPEAPAGTVSDRLQIGRAAIGLALRRRDRALADEQRLASLAEQMTYPDLDALLIAVAEHRVSADAIVDRLIASVDNRTAPTHAITPSPATPPRQQPGSFPSTNLAE